MGHPWNQEATWFSDGQINHHSLPLCLRENSLTWCTLGQCHHLGPSARMFPDTSLPQEKSSGMAPHQTLRQARLQRVEPLDGCCCRPSSSLCLFQESNYIIFKSPNLVLFLLCTSLLQCRSIFPSLLLGSKPQLCCRICLHIAEAKLFPATARQLSLLKVCHANQKKITRGWMGPIHLSPCRKLQLKVTSGGKTSCAWQAVACAPSAVAAAQWRAPGWALYSKSQEFQVQPRTLFSPLKQEFSELMRMLSAWAEASSCNVPGK